MIDFLFGLLTGVVGTIFSVGVWNHFNNEAYVYLVFYILPAGLYIIWKIVK